MHRTLRSFASIVVLAAALAGCSSGYKAGSQTSTSIQTAADQINSVAGQIDATVASLNKLSGASASADLRPLYKDFTSKVDTLEDRADSARKRAAEMKSKGDSYFKKWDQELADMNNQEIRAQSEARRAEVQKAFDAIRAKSQSVAEAYRPLMSNLQDIRTALNNDLTAGGIASVKPTAAKVADEAAKVKAAAADLAAEFKALGVKMSPKGS